MVQLARHPVDGGLGCAVGVYVEGQVRADGDAAHGGGDNDKFGLRARAQQRVRRLEEDQGPVGVDLR